MEPMEYSNYTCTQKVLLVQLANKYLSEGWRYHNHADINIKELYYAMVKKGAAAIEFCAMAEQFKECHVWLYGE